MVEVDHIDVFYGEAQALFDVSVRIEKGEIVSLIGPNGAGKTTLMGAISGLVGIKKGMIRFEDRRVDNLGSDKRVELGIIHVPEGRKLFPEMTVRENLELGAYSKRCRFKSQATMEKVFSIFPVLEKRKEQNAGTMSGGEQQMLAIGRGLMGSPTLLMLDEISLGLSPMFAGHIFQVIREINAHGLTTIFLVEQNVKMALKISQRTYVCKEGRITLEGLSKQLINDPEIKKAYLGAKSK
jgi:branched-chain amino acid transport system ATP-binding protein